MHVGIRIQGDFLPTYKFRGYFYKHMKLQSPTPEDAIQHWEPKATGKNRYHRNLNEYSSEEEDKIITISKLFL